MSAVTFDHIEFETETSHAVPERRSGPREEEFRSALERYMADYIACQKRCAEARTALSRREDV
ncbi:hypothetical protein RFM99_26990 [Mesorhizobium sp. VK4C]|uniref:hypothetical protein n=1 Tax=Mesorhizobium captivum TaxID=3072319 RepID=UPI002A23C246|nr:hypothetical protein [Mesorhizobium sp. VK4C]MDX8502046.1 hypothetical protein [Mesorhizobium sp. VK4C]